MLTVSLIIRLTSVTKFIYLRDVTIVKFIKKSKVMISNHGDYKFIIEDYDPCELESLANSITEWMEPYEYRAIIKHDNHTHTHGFYIAPDSTWKKCERDKFNIYR